ncbi:MAG TPA: ATP-binding protein, partial [bacterium]
RKYIDYLESAFLIIKLSTVDENCRTMKRERNFKIYLNNPSMRAALFAPVDPEDSVSIGHLAESAVFSQWQHARSFRQLRYSRWRSGEVNIVYLDTADDKPFWIGEVKWSDRTADPTSDDLKGIKALLKKHDSIISGFVTTKTISRTFEIQGREIRLIPTALYCYTVGRNITSSLDKFYRVELSNVEEEVQRTR